MKWPCPYRFCKLGNILIFVLFLTFTGVLFAQSQETRDALQEQRLGQLEMMNNASAMNMTELAKELGTLRASVDRLTGIGIGLGAALTSLQGLMVIISLRNGRRGS